MSCGHPRLRVGSEQKVKEPEVKVVREPGLAQDRKDMKRRLQLVLVLSFLLQQTLVVTVAQEVDPRVARQTARAAEITKPGTADGEPSSELAGDRRPLYRLCRSDVVDLTFVFSPEFNQTSSVQPDGYLALKGAEAVYAQGQTVPDLKELIRQAYANTLHDPEVTVTLREFDRPSFIATGKVARPGKYELRGETTVTEAVAIAGGFTEDAKHSQVVLFRKRSNELVEARVLNVKQMLKKQSLAEDPHLRPEDLVFVPQNTISKIRRYLPMSSLGMYLSSQPF